MTGRGGWPMTVFMTPERRAVLRRHLLPEADVPPADRGDRRRVAQPPRRAGQERRAAARGDLAVGPHEGRRATCRPRRRSPATVAALVRRLRPRVGRLRLGAEVPVDDEPRPRARRDRAPADPTTRRRRPDDGARHVARRDGVGRHVRPHRRRVRPLLGRRARGWCRTSRRCSTTRRCSCACYAHAAATFQDGRGGARSSSETVDVRAARAAPARRRVLLRRGRRLARTRRPQPRGPVPHVDARRGARRARRRADADAAMAYYDITDAGQLRGGSRSIPNRIAHRGDWDRPPAIEAARAAALFAGAVRAAAARARRQGAHRVERLDDLVARRGRRAARPSRLDRRGSAGGALPHRRAARRERPLEPGVARRRRPPGPPRRARRRPRRARRRVHPARPRRPARRRWIAEALATADTLLDHFWDAGEGGLFTTPDDGEQLIARQKDLFDNATPSANSTAAVALVPPRRAHRRGALRQPRRPDPAARRPGRSAAAASGFGNALAALALRTRGIKEVAVVGDRPDLLAVVRERWRPNVVLAWGEPLRLTAVGRPAATASPTSASTSPARPRRTPPTASAPNSTPR